MRPIERFFAPLSLVVILAACGDADPAGLFAPDDPSARAADTSAPVAQLQGRINDLFPQPQRSAALKLFARLKNGVANGDLALALSSSADLIQLAIDTDLNLPAGQVEEDVELAFAEEIYRFIGGTEDVAVTFVQPGQTTTLKAPSEEAGVEFPPDASDEEFVAAIYRVSLGEGEVCLPTARPQREGCYQYATVPEIPQFDNPAIVGICFDSSGLTEEQEDRYRLYKHDEGDANVVPLENVPVPFSLACEPELSFGNGVLGRVASALVGLVAPKKAYAADQGLGGMAGSFSRIGWAASTVLVYGPTMESSLYGGHTEASLAQDAGHQAVVVDAPTWAALPATGAGGFADYDALIIGEASGSLAAAEGNAATWGAVVNGHVVVNALHAVAHYCVAGDLNQVGAPCPENAQFPATGGPLMKNITDWITRGDFDGESTWTGLYIGLGLRHQNQDPVNPSPLAVASGVAAISTLGRGPVGSFGDPVDGAAVLDPTHPIFDGEHGTLTAADLGGWFLSFHQFLGAWPADFEVALEGYQRFAPGDPLLPRAGIIVRDVFPDPAPPAPS